MADKKTETPKEAKEALVIRIDWWLGRVIAMSGAITEVAKKRPVKVITPRQIVFWWNPYIESIHSTNDVDLYKNVIKGNDYFELEPYTDPRFYNDWMNWLEVASSKLGLSEIAQPQLFLAEHEKFNNVLEGKVILFQPFGSTMTKQWSDKSYRSFKIADAQYIADSFREKGYTVYQVFDKDKQPQLNWCVVCSNPNLRWIISLADRYPVIWCDSCMHHAAKAFGKQSLVMWAATDVWRYWYDSHINMWENGMVEHTPMRLWQLWFNYDIINQYSNKFSKEFLDKFIQSWLNLLQWRYK